MFPNWTTPMLTQHTHPYTVYGRSTHWKMIVSVFGTDRYIFLAFLDYILRLCQSLRDSFFYLRKLHWLLYLLLSYYYDPTMFIFCWSSNFVQKNSVKSKHGGQDSISCLLPCILLLYTEWIWTNYCKLSRNFVAAIRTTTTNCKVSFIYLYLVFPRNFRMVFLPHTNTHILLEPYCGTITEPRLSVFIQIFLCGHFFMSLVNTFHEFLITLSTLSKIWKIRRRKELNFSFRKLGGPKK